MRVETKFEVYNPRTFFFKRASSERVSNPDHCDGSAALNQLSYQENWELVVMWVDYKPEYDGYRYIYMSDVDT